VQNPTPPGRCESPECVRALEDPGQRIEDAKAAVSFLSTYDIIDLDRIGLLGICAFGGYSVTATATDLLIKALATVSGADIGAQYRVGADGKQDPTVLRRLLKAAADARTAEARDEGVAMMNVFPTNEEQARALGQHSFEGWEYYRTKRAQHPRSTGFRPWSSVDRIASFDGYKCELNETAPR
jgi:dienelactone hydrolase